MGSSNRSPGSGSEKKKTGIKEKIKNMLPGRRGKPDAPDPKDLNEIPKAAKPAAQQAANLVSVEAVNNATPKEDEVYAKDFKKGGKVDVADKAEEIPIKEDTTTVNVVGAVPEIAVNVPKPKARKHGGAKASGGKTHRTKQLAPIVSMKQETAATETKKGMSPFVSTLVAGGILLSVYVVGKAAYKWFTTRKNGKKEREATKRNYTIEQDY